MVEKIKPTQEMKPIRGARILEERKRLGLSQPVFGAAGGVSKGSQILYEKGAAPTGDYLEGVAEIGADVLYILTGERQAAAPEPATAQAIEEELLLDAYRELDGPARKKLLRSVLSEAEKGGTDQAGGKTTTTTKRPSSGGKIVNHGIAHIGNHIQGDVTIHRQSVGAGKGKKGE